MSRGVSLSCHIHTLTEARGLPSVDWFKSGLPLALEKFQKSFTAILEIRTFPSQQPTMSFRGAPRARGTGANFGGGGGRGGGGFGARGGEQFKKHTLKQFTDGWIGRGGFQQRDNGPPADVLGKEPSLEHAMLKGASSLVRSLVN
jgi:hypothetical protein